MHAIARLALVVFLWKAGENSPMPNSWKVTLPPLVAAVLLASLFVGCGDAAVRSPGGEATMPLRLGLLLNFSGGAPERSADRKRAFDLAINHINQGGGVLGQPVQVAVGDSTLAPERAVAEARRLVEQEGIHALVGPTSSANTLPVAEQVIGPAGIPTISPSASSPLLTLAEDRDFLFRTVLSDSAQGPVLAGLAKEQGLSNVAVIYANDAWGRGLFSAFQQAWTGELQAAAIEPGQTDFLPTLPEIAAGDSQALVLMTFEAEAILILEEALDSGLFDRFLFADALKTPALARAIGGARLGGMYGTGPGAAPGNPSTAAWDRAYLEEYGELPEFPYARETYDAAIALALASEAAGSVEGSAIRDRLRSIGSGPGTTAIAGAQGVAGALGILREGGSVDYDGAAVTLDWDEQGDLSRGQVGIWRFTADEKIEEVSVVPVEH